MTESSFYNNELLPPGSVQPKEPEQKDFITIKEAAKNLLALAVPNMLTYVLQNVVDITTLYFIGRTGNTGYTGIIGLGLTWYNISAYSFILGFCATIDTFVPRLFGNHQLKECGKFYYKAIIMCLLAAIPFTCLLFFGGFFLRLVLVKEPTATLAGRYSQMLIPNFFIMMQYELLKKFMNAQKIATPTTAITIIASAIHPIWCYTFIFRVFTLEDAYLGSALAKTVTNLLSLTMLITYVKWSGCCKETLGEFDKSVIFKDLKPFFSVGISSALMICFDWWAYEIMTVLAGNAGLVELSGYVALVRVNLFIFAVPVGIGMSACAFVGNNIGAGKPLTAKSYIRVAAFLNVCIVLLLDMLLILFGNVVGSFFFIDPKVVKIFSDVLFVLAIAELFDTMQGLLGRILIGMKKQHAATIAVVIAYYFIQIPLGYLLLLKLHQGLQGLWLANLVAALSLAACYALIIMIADWKHMIVESQREMTESVVAVVGPAVTAGEESDSKVEIKATIVSVSATTVKAQPQVEIY